MRRARGIEDERAGRTDPPLIARFSPVCAARDQDQVRSLVRMARNLAVGNRSLQLRELERRCGYGERRVAEKRAGRQRVNRRLSCHVVLAAASVRSQQMRRTTAQKDTLEQP